MFYVMENEVTPYNNSSTKFFIQDSRNTRLHNICFHSSNSRMWRTFSFKKIKMYFQQNDSNEIFISFIGVISTALPTATDTGFL